MANLLLRILLAVATLILIVLAIGSLLPRDYEATATISIAAPAERIFPYLNRLQSWPSWSNWNERDIPDLQIQYSGNESGTGAVQTWTEPRGTGKLWISDSQPNQSVKYESEFANFPRMTSTIQLQPDDPGTLISWTSSGRLPPGPFYGWFGNVFAQALQRDYEKSLRRLKSLVESNSTDD